jgi:PAS domain S-box-containing protein
MKPISLARSRFIMRSLFLITVAVLGLAAGGVLSTPASAQQYPIEHYGPDEGLPQIQVEALAESDQGYLLIGMRHGGVARFDGYDFTVLHPEDEPPPQYQLQDLLRDQQGRVWAAHQSGIIRYENFLGAIALQTYDETGGLPSSEVYPLEESPDGTVWAGTAKGLARYRDSSFTALPALSDQRIQALQADGDGRLWIGTKKGLYRYDGQDITQVACSEALPSSTIQALDTDSKGTLWVGTAQGAARKVGDRFVTVEATRGQSIHAFAAAGGALWMATYSSGIIRFDGETATRLTKKNGLGSNSPLDLHTDRRGNLWIGSQRGLSRLSTVPFRLYTSEHGLPSPLVWNVEGAANGGLWMGSQNGLLRFKQGRFVAYGAEEGMPPGTVWGLETDRKGRLWVGMRSGKLMRQTSAGFERAGPAKGASHPGIMIIEQGPSGDLWFGTRTGTWRYDGQRSRRDTTLPKTVTTDIHTDHAGRLWFGTREGVRVRQGDGPPLTLPDTLRAFPAMSIVEDEAGNLWFSSPQQKKMAFYDPDVPERVRWIGEEEGMYESTTWFLEFDRAGHLWMGHNTGVSRLDVQRYLRTGETHFEVYSGAEYIGGETTQNAAYTDEQGRLWFTTSDGLVQYDPAHRSAAHTPPQVHVAGISSLYGDSNLSQWADTTNANTGLPANLRLPYDQSNLTFRFTGINLSNPAGVRYQYRLKGLNKNWSSVTMQREANFTNLPSGPQTLEVRGRSNNGDWSAPTTYSFVIAPPFWQKWWFYVAVAGGLGGLLFGFMRLRERSLKQEQEHLEDQVAERTQELAQANLELEKLSMVARETDNAVVIADADGRVEWVNEAFSEVVTYTLGEIIEARGDKLSKAAGPEHEENIEAVIETAVSEQRSVTYDWSFEARHGELKYLSSMVTPVFDEQGGLHKIVVVEGDVTERKHLEHELIEARDRAKDAAQTKSAFLANMSHEIRTPMNGVIGMTSLLGDTALSGEQEEFVDVIRTSGEALLAIINDILDFSKIEAGKIEIEEQPFAVHQVVEDALDLVRTKADDKTLSLGYYVDASVPAALRGDVTRLRQVLTNLLSNAGKFTEAGEVNVHVDLAPAEESSVAGESSEESSVAEADDVRAVHFAVEDTGIGIPEDRQEDLFDSFSQADVSTTRKYGGTGLGLAISKRLAELMGGSLDVESTEGVGSTFHFTIQAAPAALPDDSKRLFEQQAALKGRRVLVVADNEINRRMVQLQTQRWGMNPTLAATGAEALRLVDEAARQAGDGTDDGTGDGEAPFDVAILDMHMPEMDGLELARRLAEEHPSVARLMLSSAGQRPDTDAAPLEAWLSKPTKAAHLLRVLEGVMPGETAAASPERETASLEHDLGERHPLRVLLAEDNEVNQKVALRVLERLGYRADVAANGHEVLDALERQRYDVVLMDVNMPEMDGLEATRRICARYDERERPCLVAVTANATQEGREACRAAGMEKYLAKPFSAQALADRLEQCEARPVDGPKAEENHPAPAPPPVEEKADFQLKHVRELVGDDPAFIDELLAGFLKDAPQRLHAMQAACRDQDANALEHAAHTLKSSCYTFGAERLADLCQTLENRGNAGRMNSDTPRLVSKAEKIFESVRGAIEDFRQEA